MQSSKNIWNDKNLPKILRGNGVVVMPTDTIYGIVGRAENKKVVESIYKIRQRDLKKPCIVLIGDVSELKKFGLALTQAQKNTIKQYKQPTSFILDCLNKKFAYLHRGTQTLAFRLPKVQALRELLLKVGPLIAPSANTEKFPASENIKDAQKYFSNRVDFYVNGGKITGKASKIVRLHKDGSSSIIRK